MTADGNCFFHAVLISTGETSDVDALRKRVCDHMKSHKDTYTGYLTTQDHKEDDAFEREIQQLSESGSWKGTLADCLPMAVANMYGKTVQIYSSNTTTPVQDVLPDISLSEVISNVPITLAYLSVRGEEHFAKKENLSFCAFPVAHCHFNG